ncbi:antibiotic biosynthesis monooxygenase family protein [Flavitalea flava]
MKRNILFALLSLLIFSRNSHAQNTKQNAMKKENYSMEVIRYTIPADSHNNFELAYQEAGKYLKASPFCLGYQVIHGNEEPNHYIILIHWTSVNDHLNGFRKSGDFMPFFNLLKPFFGNIDEMKHYDLTSNAWQKE